jgi:hypothetical protein
MGFLSKGPPLSAEQARALVAVAERAWRSWPPQQTEATRRAPVFVDVHGRLRPAQGSSAALMPADEAITALVPSLPWLEGAQRSLGLLATMPRLGAAAVVQSLAGEGPLFDGWPNLEHVLAYLAPRVDDVPEALRDALARAARWPGTDGSRRTLGELSRPSNDPAIERFYASNGLRPRPDAGALRLAASLRLTDRLAPGGLDALVDDLAAGRVDAGHPELPYLLGRAVALSAAALERLSGVALFLAEDGQRRPLSPWGQRRSTALSCRRANAPFRALLALGSTPLLAESEEGRWGPALLDVLGAPAGPEEWVAALSSDAALASPEAARIARATLLDAAARRALGPFRAQLDALPLWCAGDGMLRPASALALPEALDALLGEPWQGLLPVEGVLDARACAEAEALRGFFSFRPALAFVAEQVKAQARLGRALAEQRPLLASIERVARLRPQVPAEGAWRVGVDATHALTSAELWEADAEERLLAAGLALESRLAHPAFVAALPAGVFAPLPPVRLLEALAPALRERGSVDDGTFDAEPRAAFYRWLERRGAAVEADEQARGLLGKLHAFATEGGARRCPRELLAAPALEALELPGRPAAEVPPSVRAWLARVYRLDDAALGPLVDALLDAIARAAGAAKPDEGDELGDAGAARATGQLGHVDAPGDRERASRLTLALADALTPPPGARPEEHEARVERALRAQRASRRLRVEAQDGSFVRPRALLLALPDHRALLSRFHPSPPPALAERLGHEALGPLLLRLGAREQLDADELGALMAPGGALPGFDASLALARYVALALGADPSLRQHLDLDRAAWVPSAEATLRPPAALFWPEPGLDELLGPRPDALPHPLFARTVPPSFGRRLRFRRAADASLDDVLRPLVDGDVAPVETLRWLEGALQASAVEPAMLRRALGPRRLFLDTRGDVRAFAELGTGLDARPAWADHERWPTLSAALRLDRCPPAKARAASAAPRSTTPAADAATSPVEPSPKRGLWQKWFGGLTKSPAPAPPPAVARPLPHERAASPPRGDASSAEHPSPLAKRPAQHETWYQPSDTIRPQLDQAGNWSASRRRRPRYGFALSPGKLPPPYLYAPRTVADRFHAPTQRWERGDLPSAWSSPGARALSTVRFRGRAPAGAVLLPVPMYATVASAEVDGAPREAALGADGRSMLMLAEEAEIAFEVVLHEAPRFHDGLLELAPAAEPLLTPTAPDDELPRELSALVDELLASPLSPLARALRVRDFVRERYRYDPSYLDDERVARWLARATQGSANVHLAALHVGRAGRHLGAGVCYELNALGCELLRRVGVPAALASGWVLSGEQVDEPDHLWALALLPSDLGPRWLPLDASSTRQGTPLRLAERPRGPFRAPPPASRAPLPPPPPWAAQQPRHAPPGALPPLGELTRVARYLARQEGLGALDEGTWRRRLGALLDDPHARQQLLALLRGEGSGED